MLGMHKTILVKLMSNKVLGVAVLTASDKGQSMQFVLSTLPQVDTHHDDNWIFLKWGIMSSPLYFPFNQPGPSFLPPSFSFPTANIHSHHYKQQAISNSLKTYTWGHQSWTANRNSRWETQWSPDHTLFVVGIDSHLIQQTEPLFLHPPTLYTLLQNPSFAPQCNLSPPFLQLIPLD